MELYFLLSSSTLSFIASLGLPASVALAAVALLGYLFGRRSRLQADGQAQIRRELKRARGIIRDLEIVAQQVRRDLARHQGSLGKFSTRLHNLCAAGEQDPIDLLATETDKMLEPTQHLTVRLAHAYEMIRQQARQLMSFSSVRTDRLTGLDNRPAFEDMLATQVEMQQTYGLVCSLVMFDIDLFKHLNDEQGESRGDQVLKQVGQILDQYARESDMICRYGGEEFVALLPGTGLAGATTFAERMRTTIEKLSPVTVSCGVAEAGPQDDAAGLLARVDAALYSAKAAGRNQVFQHTGRNVTCATPRIMAAEVSAKQILRDDAARDTLRAVSKTLRNPLPLGSVSAANAR